MPASNLDTAPLDTGRPEDTEVSEKANLAPFLTEEQQKKIVRECIERHSRDVGSRAPRMQRLDKIQDMYALVTKTKNFPFQNAANIRTPAVTAPVLQISARLFDMTWPATGKVFSVVAASAAAQTYAFKTEQFSNSYVRYNIPYMATSLADTIHQKCLYGSAFRRTYWDAYTARVRSDRISIDDFVAPFAHRSSDPSMGDVPHYTWMQHMTYDEIMDLGEDKLFVNTDKIKQDQRGDEGASSFQTKTEKIDGVSPDDSDDNLPRQVLEQHFRLKLASGKHPAFDGKRHHVYAVIDAWSEQLLRLCLREENDPDDKRRYDRESAKLQQYQQAAQMRAAAEAAQQAQALAPPQIDPMTGMSIPQPVPPPLPELPPPPLGLDTLGQPRTPKPIRKRPIPFFTHYRCFPSEGFYGLGYGDLIYGIATAMNTILNQHVDGVTLRNAKPAFMSRQVRMQRGSINVQPGEFVEVDGPINQIKDAIMWLDPPANDPSTVPLVQMLDAMKDSMVGNADMMSGQVPGSNQTKAGMQILAEQMMMPISVLARQTREELRHELDKIWRCFGVFLEDDEIAEFLNVDTGAPQQEQLGRWMFSPTVHLVPASDPRAKSQRVEDYQQLFSFVMSNPFIQQGPAALPIMRAVTEEGFRLFPDGEKLIPLLPELPPQPPPPPPAKPQWAENAGFMRGEDSPVNPDDNDDEHVQFLLAFLQSGEAQAMDKTGRGMAEKHMRDHLAAKLMKKGQAFEEQRNALAGPVGNGPGALAEPANFPPPDQLLGAGA